MKPFVIFPSGGKTDSGVDSFAAKMFHGLASLSNGFPTSQSASVTEELVRPLQIHKNLYAIKEIFSPNNYGFVFSGKVTTEIKNVFEALEFEEVVFKHKFWFEYDPISKSYFEVLGNYENQMKFIDKVPNDPTLFVDDYFLLKPNFVEWNSRERTHDILDTEECVFGWPMRKSSIPLDGRFAVDDKLIGAFGALTPYIARFLIVSDQFLRIIEKHLDPLYYTVYQLKPLESSP